MSVRPDSPSPTSRAARACRRLLALAVALAGMGSGLSAAETVTVRLLDAQGNPGPLTTVPAVVHTDAEWRHLLSPEVYRVVRGAGTELACSGSYWHHKGVGIYSCAACDLPLFASGTKFESGTGWPSFFQPVDEHNLTRLDDDSYGMHRTEIRCARCGAHLGHVFSDGPAPTGERHCLNSLALQFHAAPGSATAAADR